MNKKLCILPWVHMSISPGGFVRLCCQAEGNVVADGQPMSLYEYTIEEIWNSEYMQGVRCDMVEGRSVAACRGCSVSEKQGTGSYRTLSNKEWSDEIGSFDECILTSQKNGYKVGERPASYHMVTGNACNLKCRMCNPLFSSQVAKDPVQRQWCSPAESSEPRPLVWNAGRNVVGPVELLGVVAKGFYEPDFVDNRMLRWTGGKASLTFTLPANLQAESLVLQLAGCYPATRKLKVLINDQVLYNRRLIVDQFLYKRKFSKGPVDLEFDISENVLNGSVTIRLESETFCSPQDQRNLGVAIENVEVLCRSLVTQRSEQQDTTGVERILPKEPWYQQHDWIVNELFKNPEQLKGIHLSGGEPMIQKQVEDIINFCIDQDIAKNIYLQFNLNCTVLPDRMLEKISKFKRLFLALSIDGYGPWWEYIRFPGKWSITKKNIEKLVQLPGARVMLVPVLMTYNVLNILELFEYAEEIEVECLMYPLLTPWPLDVSFLPASIKHLAAERFRDFAQQDCSKLTHDHLLQMADYLESSEDKCTEDSFQTFMLFTNDLDAGRGQNFCELHSEFLSLLDGSGFHWSDEKRYA